MKAKLFAMMRFAAQICTMVCVGASPAHPTAIRQPRNVIFVGDLMYQANAKLHCTFAEETIAGGGYGDIGSLRIPSPPSHLTIGKLLAFMRRNIPACTIWRDRVNKRVIHIAYKAVLSWKGNPLSKKLTFHGRMSIAHLQSHIFAKAFPNVHFYDNPYVRQSASPYFPNLHAFVTPIHFDVRNMTLRRFLTSGVKYKFAPQVLGSQLWIASYQVRKGKFTGHVAITLLGHPVVPSSAKKPDAKGR